MSHCPYCSGALEQVDVDAGKCLVCGKTLPKGMVLAPPMDEAGASTHDERRIAATMEVPLPEPEDADSLTPATHVDQRIVATFMPAPTPETHIEQPRPPGGLTHDDQIAATMMVSPAPEARGARGARRAGPSAGRAHAQRSCRRHLRRGCDAERKGGGPAPSLVGRQGRSGWRSADLDRAEWRGGGRRTAPGHPASRLARCLRRWPPARRLRVAGPARQRRHGDSAHGPPGLHRTDGGVEEDQPLAGPRIRIRGGSFSPRPWSPATWNIPTSCPSTIWARTNPGCSSIR